ncbi:MAG: YraN family protein [Desulfobulbus sp.]|jgi:putative endonuclease
MKARRTPQEKGRIGEELALDYLREQGYGIAEKNYRTPYGEVDIVARDGQTMVFVEVKTRSSSRFGTPFDAVDSRKQLHLCRAARAYLHCHGLAGTSARFDVISVELSRTDGGEPRITHLQNAFDCG